MRVLKFREPYKVTSTQINKEYWRHIPKNNYERAQWVITKYGIVTVSESDWETNNGSDVFTYFNTVFNGSQYSAFLDESKLSDMQVKWLSSYFAKKVVDGSWRNFI